MFRLASACCFQERNQRTDLKDASVDGLRPCLEDKLLAIIGKRQLLTDVSLFAMAEDVAQSILA